MPRCASRVAQQHGAAAIVMGLVEDGRLRAKGNDPKRTVQDCDLGFPRNHAASSQASFNVYRKENII